MADPKTRFPVNPLVIRAASGKLILPAEVAGKIQNFESTSEGTLTSIRGPTPLIPTGVFDTSSTYGNMHGIFHARLEHSTLNRDITLIHTGDSIYCHQGWNRAAPLMQLIGPRGSGAKIEAPIADHTRPQFPTQFELTDRGIVIVPQNRSRAYFFDGETILPLGYDRAPAPPIAFGPETSKSDEPNREGYSVDRSNITGTYTLNRDFGFGRIGTIDTYTHDNSLGGRLIYGSYQGAVQWLDHFGNLSPISPRSNEVVLSSQRKSDAVPDVLLKHLVWLGIDRGPDGTVARRLVRTKDLKNSGSSSLFIVPGNVGFGTITPEANVPDNHSKVWPDNTPDAWLIAEAPAVMPVPLFKLCCFGMGRLWIANTDDQPGAIIPSLPGRYGTFGSGSAIYPDPNGGEITGIWSTAGGMITTTRTSTYMIVPSDTGAGFVPAALSADIGAVAPSSFANMPNGATIWLGREGFYMYAGGQIQLISEDQRDLTDRINWARAKGACAVFDPATKEYRCWVPVDASTENNLCMIFDGQGWRRRYGEKLADVCVTKDHRRYTLGVGSARKFESDPQNGVWVLDHESRAYNPDGRTYKIETGWIEWGRSQVRKSLKTVYLSLRESMKGSATIKVYRDWRVTGTPAYEDSVNALLYSPDDPPPFWNETAFASDEWVKKRPYWKRVDLHLPSCEVYKIVIESTSPIEFMGLAIDEEPKRGGHGSRVP